MLSRALEDIRQSMELNLSGDLRVVYVEGLDEVGVGFGFLFLESLLFELSVDISLPFRLAEGPRGVEGGELRREGRSGGLVGFVSI